MRAGNVRSSMAARMTKADVQPPDRERIEARYAREGLSPHAWSNGPNDRYGWHTHGHTKILYCVQGSIVFHTRDGDLALEPGDRLEVDPGTAHAASVGDEGVVCLEAAG
jgi:mannose-6-phosphate isomerase-like protein (cupin superfamily)